MRLIVFFDLPVTTPVQRRNYSKFLKYLKKNGYLMMQESVYSKLAIDNKVVNGLISRLRENSPPEGLVQVLKVTEKQYANIENIVGEGKVYDELDDLSELIIL